MVKNILRFLLIASVSCFMLSGCSPTNDVDFVRGVIRQMAAGRYSARSAIDWDTFIAQDRDIGAKYSTLRSEKDKVDFQRYFIDGFSKGFRYMGADFSVFFNWHEVGGGQKGAKVVVANCKDTNTTMLFYVVNKEGKRKIVKISYERKKGK